MHILFVEDDDDKAEKITNEIARVRNSVTLIRAKSFGTALRQLVRNTPMVDGIMLDMSMPNYDNSIEPPEHFAGRDLLRQLKLRRISKPVFVVTMLDKFGSGSFQLSIDQLDVQLSKEFSPSYLGIIYYSSAQESWKLRLIDMLDRVEGLK
ncbi:hypothetical protein WAE61_18290 [Comamonadaceae bacterium PP-2]